MPGQPNSKLDSDSLASAAVALEAELRRFDELADVAGRMHIGSQKHLERAAGALHEALQCQERVGKRLSALTSAIAAAHRHHAESVHALEARAKEIDQRREELTGLLARFQTIGVQANQLTEALRAVMEAASGDAARAAKSPEFAVIDEQIGALAASARDVATAASDTGAIEIARQADGLRQQLQSARNKLKLLTARDESDGGEPPPRRA